MIEMRWYSTDNTTKKLQYRQKVDTTVYAGLGPFPDSWKNMQWSSWTDVPEVFESPAYKGYSSNSCPKCGLVMEGAMGYVCSQPNCPTGLGGSMS